MILTCPECGTRYVVKDGAIPPGGRQVRCASCKHSWHQDPQAPGDNVAETDQASNEYCTSRDFPAPAPDTHPAGEPGGKPAEATLSDHAHPDGPVEQVAEVEDADAHPLPDSGAVESLAQASDYRSDPLPDPVEEPAVVPEREEVDLPARTEDVPVSVDRAEPVEEQAFEAYAPMEEERPKSRGLLFALMAVLLIAAAAAAFWFLAPAEWKQRLGVSQNADTPLLVQVYERNRRTLASGNQLLEVSGKVINPTNEPQAVPPLQAKLRSLEQKVVYSWTIPPPAPTLAPGESATFNSAELNIPETAACLTVSVGEAAQVQEPCRPMAQGLESRAG